VAARDSCCGYSISFQSFKQTERQRFTKTYPNGYVFGLGASIAGTRCGISESSTAHIAGELRQMTQDWMGEVRLAFN
jgi:hypothetical protein